MTSQISEIKLDKTNPLVILKDVFFSSMDFTLRELDLKKAYEELNETEDIKIRCLRTLKDKLSKEKMKYRISDDYLLRYLRFKKYDCNKAFNTVKQLYAKMRDYPEIFNLPPNLETLLNTGFTSLLPYRDENGCLLLHINFDRWDAAKMSLSKLLCAVMAICDIVTLNPHSQIHGMRGIWNCEGASFRQIPEVTRYIFFIISTLEGSYPWRIKQIVLINCSPAAQFMYKKARFVVREKLYKRVRVLGYDYKEELHRLFNPCLIPKEYGGKIEGSEAYTTQLVMDNLPYIMSERSFAANAET